MINSVSEYTPSATAVNSNAVILVVDDDRTTRLSLRNALELEGYTVIEAENGIQALSICDHLQPDLVLLDVVMPVMDGFATCAKLLVLFGDRLPVLMLTVLDDDQYVDQAFAAGATDFITKPIHWAVLRNRVRRLLRSRQTEVLLDKIKTARIQAERDYLWNIFDSMEHYIMVTSANHAVEFLNRSAREQFGDPARKICYTYLGQEGPCEACPLKELLSLTDPGPIYYALKAKGRILEGSATRLFNPDGSVSAIMVLTDVTVRKQMEKQLEYLSLYDPLTGLYNRTYFEQEMRRMEGYGLAPVGLIICDVDGLKLINDTLGHDIGDALLKAAADVIRESSRTDDVVARIGGDEFAILLPNSDHTVVETSVNRIRGSAGEYNAVNTTHVLSISVGFALAHTSPVNMDELFKEADNCMHREKLHCSRSARSSIVQALMKALEARDFITEGHADRMQELVMVLARTLGLSERRIIDMRLLAQFHDIGKVGIPDRILFKPGPLTPQEIEEMRKHCEIGHRIALSAPDLVPIADWILKHHEWWNGQGYPLGLKGEEIPLECRILSIVDAYDAMTNNRPYRKALPHQVAMEELIKCSGTQFEPHLVQELVRKLSN